MCADPTLTRQSAAPQHGMFGLQASKGAIALITALQAIAPGWTLDSHQGVQGELLLVVTPPGEEETTPSFVLSETMAGIELAVALGDSCDTLGTFQTTEGALRHARHVMRAVEAVTAVRA